jgi:hypothetical protein
MREQGIDTLHLTPEQLDFINRLLGSADRCKVSAANAEKLNLRVFANFLREAAKMIETGADMQCRAFRDKTFL